MAPQSISQSINIDENHQEADTEYVRQKCRRFGQWMANAPPGDEVVITGISGRFPESNSVHELRDNLFNKKDMVTGDFRRFRSCSSEIPQRGGRLISLDKFDAGYFGVHQRQAMNMDPGYRITLEVVVEAIMDAGINPSELEGTRTGVLLSICLSDFENVYKCDPKLLPQQFGITGLVRSGAMHRISYALKLKGPSYLVDTACSSTLYALENAYGMIRRGMCENVLVPGIQLIFHPGSTLQFSRLGVLSPDGKCRSFDNEARGYVRSEAISCVLVQKAKNARRIYAKVVHAKVNDDGLKDRGITFPSTDMQSKLMDEFYQECGVSVDDLSYFEAHGTGTPVGDPEELNAIDRTIARKRRSPLLIGSVKSNLGHAEGGSALCSVIKVILAMETNIISPNINFKTMIKGVEGLESGRLKVVTERTRIPTEDITIGINSFGFGGSNCHVLLRSFGKTKVNHGLPLDDIPRILCVSGRSEEAVHSIFDDIGSRRLDAEFVRLIQEVYSRDFPNHFYRGYVILSRGGEIKRSCKWNAVKRPLLLIFGEFLTTFHVIGASLLELLPFKESLDRMQEILRCRKLDVKELITKKPSNLFEMVLGSIVVQLAMGDVLKLLNIITDLTFAQSLGEFALAYYRGTVTLEKVLSTVYDIGISVQRNTTGNSKGHQEENELRKKVYELVQEPKNRSILNLSVENKEATQSHCFRDTLMNLDSLKRSFHRKYVIIEVGDGKLSKVLEDNMRKQVIEKFYMCDDTNTLLNIIGNLFQYGHVPQIHKLYSEVEFPVSRKTPMLAPLIKWLHTKSWTVYRYPDPEIIDKNTVERYDIDSKHVDWGYVSGHVIDGRNLFPAIGYLHLVWRCISTESFHVPTSVVFENCKFIRAATVPTEGKLQLVVRYQHGTGNFESVNPLWGSWNPVYLTTLANTYLEEEQMGCKLTIRSHNWRRKMSDRRLDFLRDDLWRIDWSNIWCSCGSVDSNPDMSVFFAGIMTQKLIKLANPKGVIKSENGKVILTPKELDQKIEFQTAVLENDACLVTGRVKKPEEVNNVITVPPEPSVKRSSMPMKTRDIYKELRLRGYHYKGLFTGLEEYDCTTSSGLIKWNTNWVSFMDNMLQACILERDTRLLYIPVSIKRLAIDTEFHENYALNFGENPLLPVYVNKQSNSIKSGGVEICGLTANTIPRRKSPADPVLEKYVFVPNKVSLSASESVRVNMQLILENAMTNTVNAVEIVDESTNLNPVLLAPLINDALQDLPLIKPSIIVSSTVPLSVEDNVRVENRSIKSGDEYLLIVGSNMLQRRTKLDGALLALKCDGYILSREEQSYEPQDTPGIEVLTVHTTKSEKLVLCTKSRKSDISTCVHVCSKDFSWLSELKDSVKHNGTVIVYSQDDLNGVMGLVNCIRREPAGGNKFKCFLVVDSAPKFSVKDRFYQEQLKKNLCINVFKNGQWGTYRHLLIEDLDQVNCEHSFVNFTTRGDLSSLKWFEGPISCSGTVNENELLVHVYYASLNFKDVMIASGRITVDSIIQNGRERECIQGFEYTGKDTSGRRVMGMVNDGALATLLLVDPNLMWEVPETWTLEEAATVPVVYATVIYSLIMVRSLVRSSHKYGSDLTMEYCM